MEEHFWRLVDDLVDGSEIVIDRPRGSSHPRFSEFLYPLDYGYLAGTMTSDAGGVDVWRGSLAGKRVTGAILTVDTMKRDAEIKLLIGCTQAEAELACAAHQSSSSAGALVMRPGEGF